MRTFLPANRVLCLICASRQSVIRTSGPRRQRRTLVNTAQARESQLHSTTSTSSASADSPPPPAPQRTSDPVDSTFGDGTGLQNEGGKIMDGAGPSVTRNPSISDATSASSPPNHNNKKKSRRKGNSESKAIEAGSRPDASSHGAAPPPPRKEPKDGLRKKSQPETSTTTPTTAPTVPRIRRPAVHTPTPIFETVKVESKSISKRTEAKSGAAKPRDGDHKKPQTATATPITNPRILRPTIQPVNEPRPIFETVKVESKTVEAKQEVVEPSKPVVDPQKLVEEVIKRSQNAKRKKKKKKDSAPGKIEEEAPLPSKILFRFEIKPSSKNGDESTEIKVHHTKAPDLDQARQNAKLTHTPSDSGSASRPPKPSEGIGTVGKKAKEPLEAPALELLERSRQLFESGLATPPIAGHRPLRVKLWDTVAVKREDPVRPSRLEDLSTLDDTTERFTALNIDPSFQQQPETKQPEAGQQEETWVDKKEISLVDRKLLANVRLALEREGFVPKPKPEALKTEDTPKYEKLKSGLYRKHRDYEVPGFPSFEKPPERLFFPWARRKEANAEGGNSSEQAEDVQKSDNSTGSVTGSRAPSLSESFGEVLGDVKHKAATERTEAQVPGKDSTAASGQQPNGKARGMSVSQILSSLPEGDWSRSRAKAVKPDLDFKGSVKRFQSKGPEATLIKAAHEGNLDLALEALFHEGLLEAPARSIDERVFVAWRIKDMIKKKYPHMDAADYIKIIFRLATYGGVTFSHYWECFRKIITTTDDSELLERVLCKGIQLIPGFFTGQDEAPKTTDGSENKSEEPLDGQLMDGADLLLGLDKEHALGKQKSEVEEDVDLESEDMTPEEKAEAARNRRIFDPKLMIPTTGADNKYKENFWTLLIAIHARLKRRGYSTERLERFEEVLSRLRIWPTNDTCKWVISRFDIPDEERVEWWNTITWFNRTMLVRGDMGLKRKMIVMVKNRHPGPIEDLYAFLRNEPATKDRMTDYHYGLFVSAFFTCREPHRGMEVLNDMIEAVGTPGLRSWTMMMLGCSRGQDMVALHDVWSKMLSMGQIPDQLCWTTRIHGYFLAGQPQNGMAVLKEMEAYGETAGIEVVNAIVDGLLRHHFFNEALKIFQKSLESGIEPNLWSYNTLIRGFIFEGKVEETPLLLEQMKSHGLYPDVISFSMILWGLVSTRGSAFSIEFLYPYLEGMREQGHEANVQTYTCLLNALLRRDDIPSAKKVLELMAKNGIKKNAYTYTILVQYFAKIGRLDAMEECWKQMKSEKVRPDMITYQLTVEAFAKTIRRTLDKPPWEAQRMMYWLQEMIRVPINPRMGTFVAVLKRLLSEGLYEDAKTLVDLVSEMRGRVVIEQREGWVAGSYAHFEFWDIAEKMGWAPRLERNF